MQYPDLSLSKTKLLFEGTVIPAHPLALTENRTLDEERQRLLTRYYIAAGAGGMAVGVHSTQFEIRDPAVNLYETVLRLAAEELAAAAISRPFIKIAGVCGLTEQALREAAIARKYGYDMALLSMGGLQSLSEKEILLRTEKVAQQMPVFGFYLQPSVGGRVFSYDFWRAFADIPHVIAIKVAAFNRYQTLDVVRAVCHSSRRENIALYTGNDDNIIADLLTKYAFMVEGRLVEKVFVGGLLGHWAVWTSKAVALLEQVKALRDNRYEGAEALLTANIQVTDMNAAIFDPANGFHGCIPGIHEVLYRQGLLRGTWCINPKEQLSAGQSEEIDRVCAAYPQFTDDAFVTEFLQKEGITL